VPAAGVAGGVNGASVGALALGAALLAALGGDDALAATLATGAALAGGALFAICARGSRESGAPAAQDTMRAANATKPQRGRMSSSVSGRPRVGGVGKGMVDLDEKVVSHIAKRPNRPILTAMNMPLELAERRLVPDFLVRKGIQRLLKQRLREPEALEISALDRAPIALATDQANLQHYEVPAGFYELVLGSHLKYSSCLWSRGATDLTQAEEAMLALTCERAQLEDGQRILELGCGWGSLTLYMAARYPRARIIAVSNSHSQREHILRRARERGLANVSVVTADMNEFEPEHAAWFDRVVSVEMFEHMRNWRTLLERVRGWLRADGKLFLHFFAHKKWTYAFETEGDGNWMGRHFFTGGMMPSANLLREIAIPFTIKDEWIVSGTEYAKTAEAWLENLDRNEDAALAVLSGADDPARLVQRWRMFFLACAELFGFAGGSEWFVRHALLEPKVAS